MSDTQPAQVETHQGADVHALETNNPCRSEIQALKVHNSLKETPVMSSSVPTFGMPISRIAPLHGGERGARSVIAKRVSLKSKQQSMSVAVAFPLLLATMLPVAAMEGPPRDSDATLVLDHAFHFSQGNRTALPSSDCKLAAEAKAAFDAETAQGNGLTLLSHLDAERFVEAAYRGRFDSMNANLDLI
ncbi:hypothetical protein, partial [Lichenifustis flavocetrariae]